MCHSQAKLKVYEHFLVAALQVSRVQKLPSSQSQEVRQPLTCSRRLGDPEALLILPTAASSCKKVRTEAGARAKPYFCRGRWGSTSGRQPETSHRQVCLWAGE
jgi:hypothetical protein